MAPLLAKSLAFACAVTAAVGGRPCAAQADDTDPFHSAYAAAFGAGDYRLGDGTEAQTFRANFSVNLRQPHEDRAGLRLLLPIALGVQNLENGELPPGRASDEIEHAGFLPGIELAHLVGERWTFKTRAQLGLARELEGIGQESTLGAVGFRTRVAFEEAPGSPSLIAGALWTGFDSDAGERRSLLRLTAGVELDIRAASWRFRDSPMRWRPHVLKDWYYRPPSALAYGDGGFERLVEEWQVGVAAAREAGLRILFLEFEAVGLAYRFSDHSAGLRFFLNSVF